MDDFQSYLDLYAPGAATMRAALEGRIAPSSHYEAYFNVPFPELRTGLNGLGAVGDRLPRRPALGAPPTPASSSGTLIAAVAAAVLLGLWAARS
jgi:hypothetical protein